MSVKIKEYTPIDALKPYVVQYWEGIYYGNAAAALYQKILPSCYVDFILHLSDARCRVQINSVWQLSPIFYLAGFWTTPFDIQFWDKVETFNIRFKPEAMDYLFGIPAVEFVNAPGNLEDVFGSSLSSFCLQLEALKTVHERIKLTDEYLLKRLHKTKNQSGYVNIASELIRRQNCEISVDTLSKEVCISPRQLEREFKNKLGISPKTYMRMARLNHVQQIVLQQPDVSLAQLSYLSGYSDQAHFVKDFKKLTGQLPSVYITGKNKTDLLANQLF